MASPTRTSTSSSIRASRCASCSRTSRSDWPSTIAGGKPARVRIARRRISICRNTRTVIPAASCSGTRMASSPIAGRATTTTCRPRATASTTSIRSCRTRPAKASSSRSTRSWTTDRLLPEARGQSPALTGRSRGCHDLLHQNLPSISAGAAGCPDGEFPAATNGAGRSAQFAPGLGQCLDHERGAKAGGPGRFRAAPAAPRAVLELPDRHFPWRFRQFGRARHAGLGRAHAAPALDAATDGPGAGDLDADRHPARHSLGLASRCRRGHRDDDRQPLHRLAAALLGGHDAHHRVFDHARLAALFGAYQLGTSFPNWNWFLGVGKRLIMPVAALTIYQSAAVLLIARSSMVMAREQDYVTFARSRGVSEGKIFFKHAFRNALLPLYTHVMLGLGALVGGALIVETVFSYPGLGSLVVTGVNSRDYLLLQGLFVITSVSIIAANFLTDLFYPLIDPRTRKAG
ncbi:ABC transporter permease subunit [Devosia sp. D6-9]|nr:ABC transporter permease subunit [Devosia sp. D6-9]